MRQSSTQNRGCIVRDTRGLCSGAHCHGPRNAQTGKCGAVQNTKQIPGSTCAAGGTGTWLPGERAALPLLPPLLRMTGGGGVSATGRTPESGVRCVAAAGDSAPPFRGELLSAVRLAKNSGLVERRRCCLRGATHGAHQRTAVKCGLDWVRRAWQQINEGVLCRNEPVLSKGHHIATPHPAFEGKSNTRAPRSDVRAAGAYDSRARMQGGGGRVGRTHRPDCPLPKLPLRR